MQRSRLLVASTAAVPARSRTSDADAVASEQPCSAVEAVDSTTDVLKHCTIGRTSQSQWCNTQHSEAGPRADLPRPTQALSKRQRSNIYTAFFPYRAAARQLSTPAHDERAAGSVNVSQRTVNDCAFAMRNARVALAVSQALVVPQSVRSVESALRTGRHKGRELGSKKASRVLDRPLAQLVPFSIYEAKWDVSPHVRLASLCKTDHCACAVRMRQRMQRLACNDNGIGQ